MKSRIIRVAMKAKFVRLMDVNIIISMFAVCLLFSATFVQAASLTIYDNQLQNGFSDASNSWGTIRNLAHTDPETDPNKRTVHSGDYAISFEPDRAWVALSFVLSQGELNIEDYAGIEFWIHGGDVVTDEGVDTGGGQLLRFTVYNDNSQL